MRKPELLCPCGNPEMLISAIAGGADAVYLGLTQFNARIKAENFTKENLGKWVDYAHLRDTKVYFTLNTSIKQSELYSVTDTIKTAASANVDAFILTDFGLMDIIRKIAPNIAVHLSTQCGIHNAEGALFAEKSKAERIILSRETPLSEIERIIKNTSVEVEVFVHGALCVGFSGSCLMSGICDGKSGNRGECKQLCRQKYKSNITDKERYYLSTKDLCLIDYVKTLENLGVDSLKIEGRLKSKEYVYSTTKAYRYALDGRLYDDLLFDSRVAFNRGQTHGYIKGDNDNIISPDIQNHIGVSIGKVKLSEKEGKFYKNHIDTNYPLEINDGIKFLHNNTEIGGGNVSGVKNCVYTSNEMPKGADARLTLIKNYSKKIENVKKLTLIMNFYARIGEKPELTLIYKDISVKATSDYICQQAKTKQNVNDYVKDALSKINDTQFDYSVITIDAEDNVFIPKSIINAMRRDGIKRINELILKEYKKTVDYTINLKKYNKKSLNESNFIYYIINNTDLINKIENNVTHVAYFPDDYNDIINFDSFIKEKTPYKKGLVLPIISFENDLKVLYNLLRKYNTYIDFIQINNISQTIIAEKYNIPFIIGTGISIYNSLLINGLKPIAAVAGCELNEEEIAEIKTNTDIPILFYKSNYVPLMEFTHCPYKVNSIKCGDCNVKLEYTRNNMTFYIRKTKLSKCYFTLYGEFKSKYINKTNTICKNIIVIK